MSAKRTNTPKQSTPRQTTASAKSVVSSPSPKASTVYKDFAVYDGARVPKWHPVKKMRYVFYRMIGGCTISDAIAEIHWSPSEFWHLIDLKRHGPFREEYKRAKLLQGRAFADSVVTIAEGRDRISRARRKSMERLLEKTIAKASRTKNGFKAKLLMQQLVNDLRESEKDIVQRNKLQIDASKWIAKTTNPNEFGEKNAMSIATAPDGDGAKSRPFVVQFVGPDGKVVPI